MVRRMEQDDAVYGETFEIRFMWSQRRSSPRYPLNAPVAFVLEEEREQPEAERAEGRDISLGGVGLSPPETEESVPQIGSRVRLRIVMEGVDTPFNLEGEVVHADTENGFGVRFVNLPAHLRQRLKWLLTLKATD
jgi:c-di-GMP-binding flagellar brake protein YcgR